MAITPTNFRQNLFKLLDEVLESGKVLEIDRNGSIIKIVPPKKKSKLKRLVAHPDTVIGDSEELVSINWDKEWKPSI